MSNYWRSKPPPGTALDVGHPLARGLVARWPFNEGGGAIHDILNRYTGTFPTSNASWVAGASGHGIQWASTDNPILIATAGTPLVTGAIGTAYSIGITFVSTKADAAFQCIASTYDGIVSNYYSFAFFTSVDLDNDLAFYMSDATSSAHANATTLINDRRIYRALGVRDAGKMTLYLNGVQEGSSSFTDFDCPSTAPIRIGVWAGIDAYSFAGKIFDMTVWNRALNATEAQMDAQDPYGMFLAPSWRKYFVPTVGQPAMRRLGLTRFNRPVEVGREGVRIF